MTRRMTMLSRTFVFVPVVLSLVVLLLLLPDASSSSLHPHGSTTASSELKVEVGGGEEGVHSGDYHDEGPHMAPTPTWECDVCELLIEAVVPIVHANASMGETAFHREMDDLCANTFSHDPWLTGFCQSVVDKRALEFYEIVVKRQRPEVACTILNYCSSKKERESFDAGRPMIPNIDSSNSAHKGVGNDEDWAFVVMSDIHVGQESENAPWLNKVAVEKINSLIPAENIKMVFITGDITNSAMPEQWTQAKKLLSQLNIPYIPVMGNHDIWSYNSTYEEPYPTGDFKFADTFKDVLSNPRIPSSSFSYNTRPSYNPQHNITSWFQNWELQYKNIVFYGLDWISRAHAVSELGYKGGWPGAAIQDFPGGTFPWLQQRLEALRNDNKTVIFLQHHPFAMPIFIPEAIYSFNYWDKMTVLRMMLSAGQEDKYWGVIAGHLHIWYDGLAWDITSQRQWLTEATKEASSFTLVRVRGGRIASLTKLFGYDY